MPNTRSETVIKAMSGIFGLFGPPHEIVSDNGPQYSSREFQQMCDSWGITHTTSSPRYAQANGLAERMVRTIKSLIKKCSKTQQDLNSAMCNLRATPVDSGLPSPAELMFGRPIRTSLPSCHFNNKTGKQDLVNDKLEKRKDKMKETYDQHAGRELEQLQTGEKVRVRNHETGTWEPAEVVNADRPEPRSYDVRSPNGSILRRNRVDIAKMPKQTGNTSQPRKVVRFEEPPDEQAKQQDEPQPSYIPAKVATTRSGRVIRMPKWYTDDDS